MAAHKRVGGDVTDAPRKITIIFENMATIKTKSGFL